MVVRATPNEPQKTDSSKTAISFILLMIVVIPIVAIRDMLIILH